MKGIGDGPVTLAVLCGGTGSALDPIGAARVAAAASKIALVIAGVVGLGAGLAARSAHAGPLDWLIPAALRAAEYLLKLPLLGDYLDEGLAAFGEDCDAFDEGRM